MDIMTAPQMVEQLQQDLVSVQCALACFILHDDHYQTLQLTIICYRIKESVRKKKIELSSKKCQAAIFLKVSMVKHSFL